MLYATLYHDDGKDSETAMEVLRKNGIKTAALHVKNFVRYNGRIPTLTTSQGNFQGLGEITSFAQYFSSVKREYGIEL